MKMARPGASPQSTAPRLLLLAALLTVPWGLFTALHTAPIPPNTPPELDRFLSDVAAVAPPRARLLVAGGLPALAFYRATYRLYPRTVVGYLVRPYTDVDGWVGVPDTWAAAARYARAAGVRYVALWESSVVPPPARVRLRKDGGVLVEMSR
ncbi:MAG TPA: hypothetical protein VFE42_33630 [Chloroflexota bacterium]|nr:hypothetical protein [Chloroflexota bacterium]